MKGYASIQMTLYLLVFFCAVFMIIMGCKLGWKNMIQKNTAQKRRREPLSAMEKRSSAVRKARSGCHRWNIRLTVFSTE